jgi:hypothetical protein
VSAIQALIDDEQAAEERAAQREALTRRFEHHQLRGEVELASEVGGQIASLNASGHRSLEQRVATLERAVRELAHEHASARDAATAAPRKGLGRRA